MRKLASALTIATGLTLLATPVYGQDDHYPTDNTDSLTVSQSTVTPGETIVVAGGGADPGATVVITLTRSLSANGSAADVIAAGPALARSVAAVRPVAQGTITLSSTTADSDGKNRTVVRIPDNLAPGVYTLVASSGGKVLSVATIRVLAAIVGGLAFSGSNLGPGLVAGTTLIIAGGLLLLAIRRRRHSTA